MDYSNYINGSNVMLYILTQDGWLPVACLIDNPFDKVTDRVESTARGSGGNRSYIPGYHDYNIRLNGVLSKNENVVSYNHLYGLQENRTVFKWRIASSDGYIAKTGSAFITNTVLNSAAEQWVSFSATLSPASGGVGNILVWSQDGFNIVSQDGSNLIEV